MTDELKGNILGSVGGFATNLLNAVHSDFSAKHQREWQEKMWHEQNEYNTPTNMANRMRAAGLNPFAATEAQPAGSAGSGVKADSGHFQNPIESLLGLAQIRNLNAQVNHTETDAEKLVQEIENLKIIGRTLGWTEKETEQRVKNYVEEALKRNEFTLKNDNTAADTAEKNASAGLKTAQTGEINELLPFKKLNIQSSTDMQNAQAYLSRALGVTEDKLRSYKITSLDNDNQYKALLKRSQEIENHLKASYGDDLMRAKVDKENFEANKVFQEWQRLLKSEETYLALMEANLTHEQAVAAIAEYEAAFKKVFNDSQNSFLPMMDLFSNLTDFILGSIVF